MAVKNFFCVQNTDCKLFFPNSDLKDESFDLGVSDPNVTYYIACKSYNHLEQNSCEATILF